MKSVFKPLKQPLQTHYRPKRTPNRPHRPHNSLTC